MSIVLTASTLGAPGVEQQRLIGWLQAAGVGGVELRVAPGQLAEPAMSGRARRELRSAFEAAGIAVTGLASYVRVAAPLPDEVVLGALAGIYQLAADLGTEQVRVFPGAGEDLEPGEHRDEVDARAAARLDAAGSLADELGVSPLLETHDSHPRGADVARVLSRCSSRVGAVWDLMHPWRSGETLDQTWSAMEPWLADGRGSVQVKDARLPDQAPVEIGTGSLPTDEFAALLRSVGYAGALCLEWELAWHPEAPDLDVGLGSFVGWAKRTGLTS